MPASATATPTDVAAFTFLLFLLWLVLAGPGPLSLDHLIAHLLGWGRRAPNPAPGRTSVAPA